MMKKYKPLEEPFMVSAEDRNRLQLMEMRLTDLLMYARELEEEVYGQDCAPSTAQKESVDAAINLANDAQSVICQMTKDLVYNKKLAPEYYQEREVYNYGKEKEEWPYWEDPGEEN